MFIWALLISGLVVWGFLWLRFDAESYEIESLYEYNRIFTEP